MTKTILQMGKWSACIAFIAIMLSFAPQLLQLTDLLQFKWNEKWIYRLSLCIPLPFMIAILALHHTVEENRKFWTHGAVVFSSIYAALVLVNYTVRLDTVIPMTNRGMAGDINILIQSPHSFFWDLDALGYIFMGLAVLFAVPAFKGKGITKWARFSFISHAIVTPLIAFVYFYPTYSGKLLFLAVPWAITAPVTMLTLTLFFTNKLKEPDITH